MLACFLRPPLGVLRCEWVLGLLPLLTVVPEELVAQAHPLLPHVLWGSI